MEVTITETYSLSDKSIEVLRYLSTAENGCYTWYSNDHRAKHPFEEHETYYLKSEGFVRSGSDHNFGDRWVTITDKGRRLLAAATEQGGNKGD